MKHRFYLRAKSFIVGDMGYRKTMLRRLDSTFVVLSAHLRQMRYLVGPITSHDQARQAKRSFLFDITLVVSILIKRNPILSHTSNRLSARHIDYLKACGVFIRSRKESTLSYPSLM
jgi:hypothetical protein